MSDHGLRYVHGEGEAASYTNGAIRIIDSVLLVSALLAVIWTAVLLPTARKALTITALSALAMLSLAALFFTFQRTAWVALLVALGATAPSRRSRDASTARDEGYSRGSGGARCGLRRQCDRKQIDARPAGFRFDPVDISRGFQQRRVRALPHRRVEAAGAAISATLYRGSG